MDEINALSGKKPLRLPPALAYPGVNLLWRLRLSEAPGSMIHFVRWPWVVDTEKIKNELNFTFEKTTKEAFLDFHRAKKK